jgi:hypothetical protein
MFLVPKLPLGNPIAGKAPALRENHLSIASGAPSRSLGKIYVPKQELGNEGMHKNAGKEDHPADSRGD